MIYDFNQIVKRLMDVYLINSEGLAYSHPSNFQPKAQGYHFAHSEIAADIHNCITGGNPDLCVVMASPVIYATIKELKRTQITDVGIKDNMIFFMHSQGNTQIGLIDSAKDFRGDSLAHTRTRFARFNEDAVDLNIPGIVDRLLDNEIIPVYQMNTRFKLSKEMLPAIHSSSTLKYLFTETDIEELFDAQFMCTRDGINTYHIYTGIIIPD